LEGIVGKMVKKGREGKGRRGGKGKKEGNGDKAGGRRAYTVQEPADFCWPWP